MASMEELIAQAKEAAATLYTTAAQQTKAQDDAIQQSYQAAAGAVRGQGQERLGREDQARQSNVREGASAAKRFGLGSQVAPASYSGANALSSLYAGETLGDANAWGDWFDAGKGTALSRNQSQTDAFTAANVAEQTRLDRSLADYIASSYGGGGGGGGRGGGGGGNYWEDEDVWTPPNDLSGDIPWQAKQAATSQARYEGAAARYGKNPTNSASGGKSSSRTKTAVVRRGKGGSF